MEFQDNSGLNNDDLDLDQVVEIKQSRPIWLYALIILGIVLIIALIGWFVAKTYFFNGQKSNEIPENVVLETPVEELLEAEESAEIEESSENLQEIIEAGNMEQYPELLLKEAFKQHQGAKSFYYEEKFSQEEVKKAWVWRPGKVFLRAGFFTEVLIENENVYNNNIYIKNDPLLTDGLLDNQWRKYASIDINEDNLIPNERLALELFNGQFSWINPSNIKEVEYQEIKTENNIDFFVLAVKYNIERLKSLWKDTMSSQIKSAYLEGFDLTSPNLQIEYTGQIWIDTNSYLPYRVSIKRVFQSNGTQEFNSLIIFDKHNEKFDIKSPVDDEGTVYDKGMTDIYKEQLFNTQKELSVFNREIVLPFPIHAGVISDQSRGVNNLDIIVKNVFDFSVNIILEQSIPAQVSLLDASQNWEFVQDKIIWHHSLKPQQTISFRAILTPIEEILMSSPQLTIEADQLVSPYQFIAPEDLNSVFIPGSQNEDQEETAL